MVRLHRMIGAALLATGIVAGTSAAHAATGITVVGTVTLHDATGTEMPAEGARVALMCESTSDVTAVVADEDGRFAFSNVPAGPCSIRGDLQGFDGPPANVVGVPGDTVIVDVNLDIVPLSVGVDVDRAAADAPIPLSHARPRKSQRITTDHSAPPIRW